MADGRHKNTFLIQARAEFHNNERFSFGGPSYEDKEINIHDFTILLPQKLVVLHHSNIMSSAIIMASHTARGTWFSQGF